MIFMTAAAHDDWGAGAYVDVGEDLDTNSCISFSSSWALIVSILQQRPQPPLRVGGGTKHPIISHPRCQSYYYSGGLAAIAGCGLKYLFLS